MNKKPSNFEGILNSKFRAIYNPSSYKIPMLKTDKKIHIK